MSVDYEALRRKHNCPDLYVMVKIPDEDIASGRHSMASCCVPLTLDCRSPVRYRETIDNSISPDECCLDTQYYCEVHGLEELAWRANMELIESALRRGDTIWWEWRNYQAGVCGGIVNEAVSGMDWVDKVFFLAQSEAEEYRKFRAGLNLKIQNIS